MDRGRLVLAVAAVAVVLVAVAAVGFVLLGSGDEEAGTGSLAQSVLAQQDRTEQTVRATDNINVFRGSGLAFGLGVGLVVGAVVAYANRGSA